MTVHASIQYLKYRWKAKGRHGIHSPFVYAFVEDVVQNRKNIVIKGQAEFPGLPSYYFDLVARMVQYYAYQKILIVPAERSDDEANSDILLFPGNEPLLWRSLCKYFDVLKNDSVVVIGNIHESAVHTHEWNQVCIHPKALMSIDLYGIGLLFFKNEFKEKQHFVLKY